MTDIYFISLPIGKYPLGISHWAKFKEEMMFNILRNYSNKKAKL